MDTDSDWVSKASIKTLGTTGIMNGDFGRRGIDSTSKLTMTSVGKIEMDNEAT